MKIHSVKPPSPLTPLSPVAPITRRVGRPRANWSWETYKRLYVNHKYGDADTWKLNPANAVRSMEADIKNRLI